MGGKVRRIPDETLSYSRKSPTEPAPQRSHTTKTHNGPDREARLAANCWHLG